MRHFHLRSNKLLHLDVTAGLVPKWIPPSQLFWAIGTTGGFVLAAVALPVNRSALLAARLMVAMIVSFGLIVWVPMLFSNPYDHGNWGETIETFAIAGAAWILADLLAQRRARIQAEHIVSPILCAIFAVGIGFVGYWYLRFPNAVAKSFAVKRGSPFYRVSALFFSTEDDMQYLRIRTIATGILAILMSLVLFWALFLMLVPCR